MEVDHISVRVHDLGAPSPVLLRRGLIELDAIALQGRASGFEVSGQLQADSCDTPLEWDAHIKVRCLAKMQDPVATLPPHGKPVTIVRDYIEPELVGVPFSRPLSVRDEDIDAGKDRLR